MQDMIFAGLTWLCIGAAVFVWFIIKGKDDDV